MADEKIMNEEVMSYEELSEVAGGADWEIQDDANRMRALGRRYGIQLLPNRKVSTREVNAAFNRMGDLIGEYFHCKFRLGCDLQLGDEGNSYHLNHKKMERDKIWAKIYKKLGI